MIACTFFGHRDCPDTIYPRLRNCIEDLIVHHEVQCFYIGHQGRFDVLALHALRELKKLYPELRYYVVLAYLPNRKMPYPPEETIYPEGLETVPCRLAIARRNEWMLKNAEFVITYVVSPVGGAAKYKQIAFVRGKKVINLT